MRSEDEATSLLGMQCRTATVGFGELGLHGDLGYEGKRVVVGGKHFPKAISTHPPARVLFELDGSYRTFSCLVAINGDVPARATHADFSVFADGRLVASASAVIAGDAPRRLAADIEGASKVELRVETARWEYCHAVWLDPSLSSQALPAPDDDASLDCLRRAQVLRPPVVTGARRCITTVVSPGYTELLDNMLGTLSAYADCDDAALVVFVLDGDRSCQEVVERHGATVIPCRSHAKVNATSKALMYSAPRFIDAEQFVCLDADMLILGSLRPLFDALSALPGGSILACREGNGHGLADLGVAFDRAYWGSHDDARRLGLTQEERRYGLAVNDGLFAGSRHALLALDGFVRRMPGAVPWVDARRDNWWRNQFIFNLALARMGCGVELDPKWNLQLHAQDVAWESAEGRPRARWRGEEVQVLHFSGVGRRKYPKQRAWYQCVPDPLPLTGSSDAYGQFVSALRAWLGRQGTVAMTWSFYGMTDGQSARIRDASTFPLLALLHYLVRSNGCCRVLETGTARGVSAACLASAVAHRDNGRVVTLDPNDFDGREALWSLLPAPMRQAIEPRKSGSLGAMRAAIDAGERYEAALLDSIHSEAHVMAEFELATQLVCPSGLILIHDAIYTGGTVGAALDRIEAAGYGVTRLWSADGGAQEDDRLGLAVIENRRGTALGGRTRARGGVSARAAGATPVAANAPPNAPPQMPSE